MKVVSIVQRRLTHYRLPLFTQMRKDLATHGVKLRLLHGDATPREAEKKDEGHLDWAEHLPTHYALEGRLCWQPFMRRAAGSDLVIVTQENKLVNNLLALALPWRRTALAFWGHGRNMQARRPTGPAERFKRWTTLQVDWWFAYTEISAGFVRDDGFPAERITVLNNSIDTAELRRDVEAARSQPRAELRARLGLGPGPVALFMGSLYADKRIAFLLDAARALHARTPGFELVIAGDGPDRTMVQQAAAALPFVRPVGSVRGSAKAEWLVASDLMLNPGLVGLGILDSFIAGVPLLTTDCHIHSPEIAYLHSGQNGLMTADDSQAYVDAAASLLHDPAALERLRRGASESGLEYSIERMAQRFCQGILDCLAATGSRSSA